MEFSNIDLYKVFFAIEILVIEFIFMFKMKKVKYFHLKYISCSLVIILTALYFPLPYNNIWDSSIAFLSLFALSIAMMKICYKEPFKNIFFCAIASYNTQHFAYVLSSLALSAVVWGRSPILGMYSSDSIVISEFNLETFFIIIVYLICYFISYWLLYLKFGKKLQTGETMRIKSVSLLIFICIGLLVDIFLNSLIIYNNFQFVNILVDSVYNLLCCVLLLYAQFSLLITKELQGQVEVVEHLLHQSKEQYALSKENIEIINMKCHDMRHQIRKIGKNNALSDETIKEIEGSINLYESLIKTGNEVLDIILTEKSLICNKKNIVFSYMIDGALMDFMVDDDLYSLFGNAFDNAIEAVSKIDDDNKKLISFKIHSVGELVSINLKNSFYGKLDFDEDGLPITTKEDFNFHGFGIKSIAYIVDKYKGDMAVKVEDGVFSLNILFSNNKNQQNKN